MSEAKETITVRRHKINYLEMYEITADELARLQFEEPQKSHELSFGLCALSLAVGFIVSLVVGSQQMSAKTFATFVALIVVGIVFFVFFISRWSNSMQQRHLLFDRIKERQIGPVGEEGTEIEPNQLEALPSEDATGHGSLTADATLIREGAVHPPKSGKDK